jgi:hypothetical protein
MIYNKYNSHEIRCKTSDNWNNCNNIWYLDTNISATIKLPSWNIPHSLWDI